MAYNLTGSHGLNSKNFVSPCAHKALPLSLLLLLLLLLLSAPLKWVQGSVEGADSFDFLYIVPGQ